VTKTLSDEQLEAFDVEQVDDINWRKVRVCIDRDFPNGTFSMLDIGGGNGMFADRVLNDYPNCRVTLLDTSALLLSRNIANPRKRTIVGSAMDTEFEAFDIISINWVLHHLVGHSYSECRANVLGCLRRCAQRAKRLSIWENRYDGQIFDTIPSRLIYALTSSRALSSIAKAGGANTAGVGVCFQSRRQWLQSFDDAGLELLSVYDDEPFLEATGRNRLRLMALHVKPIGASHFWLKPRG
jgi:methyltransferase family protein